MAIVVKIGSGPTTTQVRLEMDIRRSMNGDLMIFDHGDIDIVLSSAKNKVIVFPKETMTDLVYGAQNRLFAHLRKKGLVIPESIQGGAFYGALEATLETASSDDLDTPKMTLINISKFIDEERPYFDFVQSYMDQEEDRLIDPDNLHSTDLGDVPHSSEKGSIRPDKVRDPYGLGMSHY